jgi:membrane-bound lytic murein transglycosylase
LRRTISFIVTSALAVVPVIALASCAQTAHDDPTLHPPGGPARKAGETVVRDLSKYDFMTAFPKRFLEQRVAFTAACEMSSRSTDKSVAADAELLYKIGLDSQGPEDFASRLQGKFELVQIEAETAGGTAGPSAKEGMMTGYATPEFVVRSRPDERFRFPIYGDIRATHPELADKPRRELVAAEAARDAVIAWIDDPLGWALIETNGTARLKFDDGGMKDGKPRKRICVSRIATNGREWTSLGRWLANRGLVDGTYTFADVVRAAEKLPDQAAEAALDNERVVFFAVVDEKAFPPPLGLPAGKLLSAYSCAADQSIYPPGTVLIVFDRGEGVREPRSARFLFVHDAGGAIKGAGRIDLYFGEGIDAVAQAGQTRTPIEVYRLRRRN